jgi:hypothetical protein
MNLIPLTEEVLFSLYGSYNQALPIVPFLGLALCIVCLLMVVRPFPGSTRAISALLAVFWLWNGAVFQFGFLAPLTWVAWIFGVFFVLEGLLFLWLGAARDRLHYRPALGPRGLGGLILLAFALAYPALDMLAGQRWPQLQFAGTLPSPTVLATFAFLLLTQGRTASPLAIIPLLWALLHGAAAFVLGVWQDVAMAIAASGAFLLLLFTQERRG